ncbi:MerR family transcriptional regulator [Aquabacterium sp. A3]|uniref:MerR family transcriptional regulator n=1 Tax=Aquabacterium sp. A3 TaxID=3132829 RepID=UPI00311A2BCF
MKHDNGLDDSGMPRYRSSAAARMVNIPVATLRVWERRYKVVGPQQAPSGHRLYSSQDVRRLVLIKQLLNKGHSIGMLARLDTARLQELLDEAENTVSLTQRTAMERPAQREVSLDEALTQPVRVLLAGPDAAPRWRDVLDAMPGIEVIGSAEDSGPAELALRQAQADVVVADLGPVHMETVDWLVRLTRLVGARQMIVVYGFANSQVLEALRARAALIKRAPIEAGELGQVVRDTVRGWRTVAQGLRSVPDPAPPRRFDAVALQQLIRAMPRVACECPQHLSELVRLLSQFEEYSAECETRQPADVALHAYLYRVAGHARALMEEALATLAVAEGVPLPDRMPSGRA